MVGWLFSQGLNRLFLGTGQGTRAQRFYEGAGWTRTGTDRDEATYELRVTPSTG